MGSATWLGSGLGLGLRLGRGRGRGWGRGWGQAEVGVVHCPWEAPISRDRGRGKGHQAGLPDWFYNTFSGLKGEKIIWQQAAASKQQASN